MQKDPTSNKETEAIRRRREPVPWMIWTRVGAAIKASKSYKKGVTRNVELCTKLQENTDKEDKGSHTSHNTAGVSFLWLTETDATSIGFCTCVRNNTSSSLISLLRRESYVCIDTS